MRQGPHQGAQKSTSTGTDESSTSDCQLASVNSITLPAICIASPRSKSNRILDLLTIIGPEWADGSTLILIIGRGPFESTGATEPVFPRSFRSLDAPGPSSKLGWCGVDVRSSMAVGRGL